MKYLSLLTVAVTGILFAPPLAGQEKPASDKQQVKAVDPSGTWRLEYDWNDARIKDAFRLRVDGDNKLVGSLMRNGGQVLDISNAKISGDEISFTVSAEYEGTEWKTEYTGDVDGDSIDGTVVLKVGDQSWDLPWRPERSVHKEDVVGTWKIHIDAPNGTSFDPTMKISKADDKLTASYTSKQGQELAVKDLRVEDNHLLFTVTAEWNETSIKVDYKGRPYGDKMTGTLDYDLGGNTGEIEFTAKREAEKKESTENKNDVSGNAKAVGGSIAGYRVPDFVLPDSSGQQLALSDFKDAKTLVVIFMGTECPIGNAYVPDLIDLCDRYRDQNVQVIGINANLSDSAQTVAEHIKEFNINFPVLVDDDQLAVDLFAAKRTPEAFVLDKRRRIRYRGRIDDRFGYDYKRDQPKRSDLEEAVKELVAGKAVSVAETELEGCLITRRSSLKRKGEITYAKQVSRILHQRCASCHHPDTAAPFSLLSYEQARDWSEMIGEVVAQRRMPPWNADPRYGKFINDLRMPKDEIDTLVAWINEGAPLGDEKDLPEPPNYADGWVIGKPDVVFKMPEEFTVQAKGAVEYQYFVTPTNFEKDVWVQASEPRPGNRSVVHHIIVFVRDKNTKRLRNLPAVGGFAPGEEPIEHPEGIGFKIPAGADLVWQVHYTPTGKVEKDRSEIGLLFCKEPPERRVQGGGAFNVSFNIPPGDDNHRVVSNANFSRDVELLALMPHMHLRGKDFRYTAKYPDGREEILLNVPDYDFNWQHRYRFAEPVPLPKGTTIECVAHFDNSADNPANPDPDKPVRWGDQTWEEMMIGWYSHVNAQASSQ